MIYKNFDNQEYYSPKSGFLLPFDATQRYILQYCIEQNLDASPIAYPNIPAEKMDYLAHFLLPSTVERFHLYEAYGVNYYDLWMLGQLDFSMSRTELICICAKKGIHVLLDDKINAATIPEEFLDDFIQTSLDKHDLYSLYESCSSDEEYVGKRNEYIKKRNKWNKIASIWSMIIDPNLLPIGARRKKDVYDIILDAEEERNKAVEELKKIKNEQK